MAAATVADAPGNNRINNKRQGDLSLLRIGSVSIQIGRGVPDDMPIIDAAIFQPLDLFFDFLSVICDIRREQGIISLDIGNGTGGSGCFLLPVGNVLCPV